MPAGNPWYSIGPVSRHFGELQNSQRPVRTWSEDHSARFPGDRRRISAAAEWYPDRLNTVGRGLTQGTTQIGFDLLANIGSEFWPDVKKKILHRKP